MKLVSSQGQPSQNETHTAMLFGVKDLLERHQLRLCIIRSHLSKIVPDEDQASFCCYKLPKDTDAKIGVRRDPQNPNNIHGRKTCHNEKRKSFNSSILVRLSYKKTKNIRL